MLLFQTQRAAGCRKTGRGAPRASGATPIRGLRVRAPWGQRVERGSQRHRRCSRAPPLVDGCGRSWEPRSPGARGVPAGRKPQWGARPTGHGGRLRGCPREDRAQRRAERRRGHGA